MIYYGYQAIAQRSVIFDKRGKTEDLWERDMVADLFDYNISAMDHLLKTRNVEAKQMGSLYDPPADCLGHSAFVTQFRVAFDIRQALFSEILKALQLVK